jgi:hypothetical protein
VTSAMPLQVPSEFAKAAFQVTFFHISNCTIIIVQRSTVNNCMKLRPCREGKT